MTNHSQQIMETVGLRVRLEHTVGQTTTIISSNSVRLDRFSMFAHNIWVAPIQIVIGIGLLINNVRAPLVLLSSIFYLTRRYSWATPRSWAWASSCSASRCR
ncbi:hypothetical protein C8R47DRAFT_1231148 [Mycena vitilis]|nr:hypothetical protein C8R47DRAFT_1231148 [Mycena vitilis]